MANKIHLKPNRLNFPLAQCVVGKLSSAVFEIAGDIPDDIENLTLHIERIRVEGEVRPNFVAAASRQDGGEFRAYLSPFYFPDVSDDLRYHVIGMDANGNPRWLGTGDLRVLENPANGAAVAPEVIPQDAYAYNPTTGLYHKLTAVILDGEITIDVAQEGVAR